MGVFNFPNFIIRTNPVLPSSFDDTISYYETLTKTVAYLNKISKNMNILADSLVDPYDEAKYYEPGDYCWYNNKLYKAIIYNHGMWSNSAWEEVVFTDSIANDINEFIDSANTNYNEFTTAILTNTEKMVTQIYTIISNIARPYSPSTIYSVGSYCTYKPNAEIYDASESYEPGDYCYYENKTWKCRNTTTGTFNIGDWDEVGFLYKSIATVNQEATFNPTKWQSVIVIEELNAEIARLWNNFFDEYELNLGLSETIGTSDAEAITQKSITEYFNTTPTNLLNLDKTEIEAGFYRPRGILDTSWNYVHTFIPCSGGDEFFTNITTSNLTITFFDANKNYVSHTSYTTNKTIKIPTTGNIAYMSIPLLYGRMATYIVSNQKISDKYVRGASCGVTGFSESDFYRKIKINSSSAENNTITCTAYKNCAVIKTQETSTNHKWIAVKTNITHAIVEGQTQSILLLAYSDKDAYGYVFADGSIIKVDYDETSANYTTISTEYTNTFTKFRIGGRFSISYGNTITIQSLDENKKIEIPIYKYISDGYKLSYGYIWKSRDQILNRQYEQYINCISVVNEPITLNHNQWEGKKWYAYGTSITNINNEGKYPLYLRNFSGMELTNKGISGGGIGDLGGYSHGQVYSAICNITDGKLEADLITLETGANDASTNVPLGTIYDTGTSTLSGCLNDCLRYLQTNTTAQICVFYSPSTTTMPNAINQYFEWAEMVRKICFINGVHYLNSACNLGYGKITSNTGNLYVVDNIHQTNLGGYIYAQNIWNQLKQIPTFKTSLI